MGWLGTLLGRRPSLPAGATAFAFDESHVGTRWTIRYRIGDQEETTDCPRVKGSPTFETQVKAYDYVSWLQGESPAFDYGPGAA